MYATVGENIITKAQDLYGRVKDPLASLYKGVFNKDLKLGPLVGSPDADGNVVPPTEPREESFVQKYGLWIAIGAAALFVLPKLTR